MARTPWPALALFAAMLVASPARAAPESPLDQEIWAGISYRDAFVGAAVLGGGAVVVSLVTGATATALAAVIAVAVTYVVFDPVMTDVVSPSDLPSLPELRRRGAKE